MALFEALRNAIKKPEPLKPMYAPQGMERYSQYKAEADVASNTARKENSLFGVMANTVKGIITKKGRADTKDVLWNVGYKKPVTTATNVVRDIAQSTARSGASFAKGVVDQPVDPRTSLKERIEILKRAEVTPKSKFAKALTGRKEKFSLASEGETLMRDLGFDEEKVMKYGPTAGLVIGSLDLTGFGGAERKVAQQGLETIAKSKNTVKIAEELVKTFKVGADEAAEIAPKLVDVNSKEAVKDVLDQFINSKIGQAGVKERGFIESVQNSPNVSPEVKEGLSNKFTPRPDEEMLTKAKELVKTNPTEAENMVFRAPASSDDAVVTGIELGKHYDDLAKNAIDPTQKAEYIAKSREIYSKLSEAGTESGRSLRAYRMLNDGSPTNIVKALASDADKAVAKGVKGAKKIPDEEYARFMDRAQAIEESTDFMYKLKETKKMSNELKQYVPTKTWKRITTVWKAGLLTGIKTSGLNITSNFFHSVSEVAKDIPATMVDIPVSMMTGKRSKAFTVKGLGSGAKDGVKKGWQMIKTGVDDTNSLKNLEIVEVNFPKNKVGNALKKYTDTVFNIIGAEDKPMYYGARARSLYEQAIVSAKNQKIKFGSAKEKTEWIEGFVKNPPEDALELATNDALVAVFQNATKLGDIASGLQKKGAVTEFIIPFSRTPASVAMQMVNYSPAGPVLEIAKQIGKGAFDQKAFVEAIGRGTIGTAGMMWIGRKLQKEGKISFAYDRKNTKENELDKAEGVSKSSFKIGDKWVPVSYLGPVGYLLVMGAYYERAIDKTGSVSAAASEAMFKGIQSLKDQTFLTGVNQFLELLEDDGSWNRNFLPNFTGSFVPSFVKDVGQAFDPYKRQAEGVQGFQSRLPGARNKLPPQIDMFGNPIKRPQGAVGSVLSPFRASTATDTPVTQEVRRLVESGYTDVGIEKLDRVQNGIRLNQREYTFAQILVGKQLEQVYTQIINSPQYQEMSDEEKEALIYKYKKEATKAVKDQAFEVLMAKRYNVDQSQRAQAVQVIKALADKDAFKNATKRSKDEMIVKVLKLSGINILESTE